MRTSPHADSERSCRPVTLFLRKIRVSGFLDRTADMLLSPKARFAGNPHLSGKGGGHTINLHQFARDGVKLLGHMTNAAGHAIALALDLQENLAKPVLSGCRGSTQRNPGCPSASARKRPTSWRISQQSVERRHVGSVARESGNIWPPEIVRRMAGLLPSVHGGSFVV
jgi:hypothetical protein